MPEHPHPLILFVPGKNPKPPAEPHRSQLYRCLAEGVRRAGFDFAADMETHPEWFEVLAWNEMFYHSTRDISDETPWVDRLLSIGGPTPLDKREAHAWKTRLAWVLYSLADRLPILIPMIANEAIRSTLQEIRLYFEDVESIASRIRGLLNERLRRAYQTEQPVLLIGHSLGSVIAYDALWEMTHKHDYRRLVDLFLTIGSPLGLSFVQKRLLGADREGVERYPANIRHWVNISSMGELTALDREFADDFREMVELGLVEGIRDYHKGIYNYYRDDLGLNVHRSYGYLINHATGRIVGEWLAENLPG